MSVSRAPLRKFLADLAINGAITNRSSGSPSRNPRAPGPSRRRAGRAGTGPDSGCPPDEFEDPASAIINMPVAVEDLSSEILKQPVVIDDQPSAMAAVIRQSAADEYQ